MVLLGDDTGLLPAHPSVQVARNILSADTSAAQAASPQPF